MKINGRNLKIAIQRKGRLAESSRQLLASLGLRFEYSDGRLFSRCRNFPLDLLFLRDDDIPEYVQDGVADLGIVGLNVVEEKQARVVRLDRLGFGACTLTIAVPRSSRVSDPLQLEGMRIATSYPVILANYLREKSIEARIVRISGSVEIAPGLDVAEAIFDLVSTGSTLRLNDLEPLATVLESEAILVANPDSFKSEEKIRTIERLRTRIQGTLKARSTKYVMMNAPRSALDRIVRILPGMSSPTVLPLADKEMIAVHCAVPEETFWEVIEKLKSAGAGDILVVPVEKLVC